MIGGKGIELLISPPPSSGLIGSSPSPDPLSTSVGFSVGVIDEVVGSTGPSVLTVVCTERGRGRGGETREREGGEGGERGGEGGERGREWGEIVNYTKHMVELRHISTRNIKRDMCD